MSKKGDPRLTQRWAKLRKQILDADDTCHICHAPGADTVDHLHPISQGGDPYDPTTLAPAHRICNSRRGAPKPGFKASPLLPRPQQRLLSPERRVSPWSSHNGLDEGSFDE